MGCGWALYLPFCLVGRVIEYNWADSGPGQALASEGPTVHCEKTSHPGDLQYIVSLENKGEVSVRNDVGSVAELPSAYG